MSCGRRRGRDAWSADETLAIAAAPFTRISIADIGHEKGHAHGILPVAELYEACQLRLPVSEAHLPCRDDPLGHAAVAAIDELRIPLRDLLKRRVSSIHGDDQPE